MSLSFFLASSPGHPVPTAPALSVLPWNGAPAALSLTFDDGDPSQLDVAVPCLDERGWKATFFLIANKIDRRDEWRKVFESGHELGNHSLDHLHAQQLDAAGEKAQVVGSLDSLQKIFGVPVRTYAYAFCEESPGLKKWTSKTHLAARGCPRGRDYLNPSDIPDWMDLPSRITKTADKPATHKTWLGETLLHGAWTILMIHGLEGTTEGWEPVSKKVFKALLSEAASGKFWVAPMGEVAAYWKAQKIVEGSSPQKVKNGFHWTWKTPNDFPRSIHLKVRLSAPLYDSRTWQAVSDGKILVPDADGILLLPFDSQVLDFHHE